MKINILSRIFDLLVSDFKAEICSAEFWSAEDEIKVKAQLSSETPGNFQEKSKVANLPANIDQLLIWD